MNLDESILREAVPLNSIASEDGGGETRLHTGSKSPSSILSCIRLRAGAISAPGKRRLLRCTRFLLLGEELGTALDVGRRRRFRSRGRTRRRREMGIYNFRKQFTAKILSGEKQHTIRRIRAVPDKPGSTLHLYTGLRRKGAELLMRVPCARVETIEIDVCGHDPFVAIGGVELDAPERESLARADGFPDFATMLEFWTGRLPFEGHIIHWRFAEATR